MVVPTIEYKPRDTVYLYYESEVVQGRIDSVSFDEYSVRYIVWIPGVARHYTCSDKELASSTEALELKFLRREMQKRHRRLDDLNIELNKLEAEIKDMVVREAQLCVAIDKAASCPAGDPFLDDNDKMLDFWALSKDDFLKSYSYLKEEDYDATVKIIKTKMKEVGNE